MREVSVGNAGSKLLVRVAGGTDREGGGDGPLVVLLHGFGAPGNDLVPLYRQLDVPHEVRFAFPEAPIDLSRDLGPAYAGGRAWWLIDPRTLGQPGDRSNVVPDGLVEARSALTAALDELGTSLGAATERTILGGFSQGAMLSLDVLLHAEHRFAGLVQMSGTLIALPEWQPRLGAVRGLPVLQSHGRGDPLLPFAAAERLRDLLRAAGADLDWVEFSGGHTITNGVVARLAELVRRVH
jgi:phospholipase/carboxylesterase